MIDSIEKNKCTGCKMCADLCHAHAITFQTDEEGFWYPKVDKEKCNHCGLCIGKCPSLNAQRVKETSTPIVYAAWSRDGHIRHESTSGGVFFEIAKLFIREGGVVAGSRYGQDWKSAEHFVAHDMEELESLRGSKYFQSDTAGIYQQVKQEAEEGKKVLFCGTPCQNAALASYLSKEYSNVYFMDFICRSINSPLAFARYISELEDVYGAKVVKVQLKNKQKGWHSLASQVCFSNGKESLLDREHDWWVKGFVGNDLYTREACYSCQYRTLPRKTVDITIGDFWGIVGESNYDNFQGISVVLVNTSKGEELFEQAKPCLYVKKKSINEVLPGNPALLKNPVWPQKQERFFELLQSNSFSEAVISCTNALASNKNSCWKRLRKIIRDWKKDKKGRELSTLQYFYLNYFCKNVIREDEARIIPFKNAVIELHPTAVIRLQGDVNFEVGINKLKGSKAETYIRMDRDSQWNAHHGGALFFNTTLEVKEHAVFDSGFFTMNSGSAVVVDKKVTFGEDVMLGRNILVYDSDFHQLQDENGNQLNPPKEVRIEDHVWLTSNVTVLKGVTIGQDSLITAQTVISKSMPEHSIIAGAAMGKCIKDNVKWSRVQTSGYGEIARKSKIILFGYGIAGKRFLSLYRENVKYIVDNFAKDEGVYTFKEFQEKYPELEDDYIWVIASPRYFSELYWQVKDHYPQMLIIDESRIK